jgi:hypothetical protein
VINPDTNPITAIEALETVPQNLFSISPVRRPRPYIGKLENRKKYEEFMTLEHGVLSARIAELNSRADQIMYIHLCREHKLYLSVANRVTADRADDRFFYDWLDELYEAGIAYAGKRNFYDADKPGIYRWDDIQQVIDICLSKGLDLETASKVATVGVKAVEKYLKTGVITLDTVQETRHVIGDTNLPDNRDPDEDAAEVDILAEDVEKERQADVLAELATVRSSRGATMLAKARTDTTFARISAINRMAEEILPGYIGYDIEVQEVVAATGEYTPFNTKWIAEKDTPIKLVKFVLAKLSLSLSRTL